MVVCEGDTCVVPEMAFPVEKLVPVQEVELAAVEDQLRVAELPCCTEVGERETEQRGATLQVALVYVPERTPLVHVRCWETAAQVDVATTCDAL